MYNCPNCNNLFNKGTKLCSMCGYDLETGFLYNPVCPTCGKQYPDGTQFCKADNAKLIPYDDLLVTCIRCGKKYPPYVTICPEDGSSVRPQVKPKEDYTTPNPNKAYYSELQGYYVYPKASLGSRFLGWFLDGLYMGFFAVFITLIFLLIFSNSLSGSHGFSNSSAYLLIFLLMFIPILVYGFIKDGLGSGQSWGKRGAGLMVINLENNEPCTMGKSALRNLVLNLPYISLVEYIMVFANNKGKRLGDLIANTQVIEESDYAPQITRKTPDTIK